MRTLSCSLALTLLLLALQPQARADELPSDEAISRAIKRGRAFLLRDQTGRTPEAGLAAFALLRSGVPAGRLQNLLGTLQRKPMRGVYEAGVYALALEAMALEAKDPDFPWRTRVRKPCPPQARNELKRVVRFLLRAEGKVLRGSWAYNVPAPRARHYDNSNTQFAVYGLAAASRSGVEVDPEVWERILAHWLRDLGPTKDEVELQLEHGAFSPFAKPKEEQKPKDEPKEGTREREGAGDATQQKKVKQKETVLAAGWDYCRYKDDSVVMPYTAMTGAGVSSLAYVLERVRALELPASPLHAQAEQAARGGLAWLQHHLKDALAPGGDGMTRAFPYYALWSLEKGFDSTHVQRVAQQDWWRLGARWLLEKQEQDGSWQIESDVRGPSLVRARTCFALLFLSRATLPAAGATQEVIAVEKRAGPKPAVVAKRDQRQRTGAAERTWDRVTLADGRTVALGQTLEILAQTEDRKQRRELLAEVKEAWERLAPEWQAGLLPLVRKVGATKGGTRRDWAKRAVRDLAPKRRDREALEQRLAEWERLELAARDGRLDELPHALEVALQADVPWRERAPVWLRLRALRTVAELRGFEHAAGLLPIFAGKTPLELRTRAREVLAGLFPETKDLPPPPAYAWTAWAEDLEPPAADVLLRRDLDLYLRGGEGTRDALLERRGAAFLLARGLLPDLGKEQLARAKELLALLDPPAQVVDAKQ
mgnify:CR=1 FL=1